VQNITAVCFLFDLYEPT